MGSRAGEGVVAEGAIFNCYCVFLSRCLWMLVVMCKFVATEIEFGRKLLSDRP